MSNTLTQTQLTDVIKAIINTNALLANYLHHNNNQESNPTATPKPALPKTDWSYASTTLVSKYTGERYNWRELERYCKANGLKIAREVLNRLHLNSYPASAWYAVYGVVLGKF